MNFLSKSLVLLLALIVFAPALAKSEKCHDKEEIVKYVQGGAAPGGNGSRKHPFASLADAETATWNVLIVLSSPFALDGGINLTSGQKLIGEEDPTGIVLSPTQPTITNSSNATNNGHGAVVNGNVTIKNIYFKNTYASAINYDNAENLTVLDVLATGYNSGGGIKSGINGTCQNPGNTHIEHVIIRNNVAGTGSFAGIDDVPHVHRDLTVCNCEFSGLTNNGIYTQPTTAAASSSVIIKDCYLHDFTGAGAGLVCQPINATETVLLKNSIFTNVGIVFGCEIVLEARESDLKICVDSCSFTETTTPNFVDTIALFSFNSLCNITAKNSLVTTGNAFFYNSRIEDNEDTQPSTVQEKFCGNTVTAQGFYSVTNTSNFFPVERAHITDNLFIGNTVFQINNNPNKWALLDIIAEHNCFTGTTGSVAFRTIANKNIGSVIYNAHENSFVSFTRDITDAGSNVNYLVSKNFWGPTTSCMTSADCIPPYQICKGGMCLGPTVSSNGSGYIDASHPLAQSIQCPHGCCNVQSKTPLQQTIELSDEQRHEMIEKSREQIRARYYQTKASQVP